MRRFEKATRLHHCALRVDAMVEQWDGDGAGGQSGGIDMVQSSSQFVAVVSSHNVSMAIRGCLSALFGASAPEVANVAADAEKQLIHVSVSDGDAGVKKLRAACALVTSIVSAQTTDSGRPQRVPTRVTVVRCGK